MEGVYLITNLVNGKHYVGISNDIHYRWSRHRCDCFNKKLASYEYPLYRAFRKYGLQNFSFEVLEEEDDLAKRKEKEIFYISKFEAFGPKGYNQTPGGDNYGISPDRALTEEEVVNIRLRWAACLETNRQIYDDYCHKISYSGFEKIIGWKHYKEILPDLPTEELKKKHYTITQQMSHSILSAQEVIEIRKRYELGERPFQIAKDFPQVCLGQVKAICYYQKWKNITREQILELIKNDL